MRFYSAIIVVSSLFSGLIAKGQVWFDLGLRGGVGTTALMNLNTWDDRNATPIIGTGNFGGGKVGVYVGMNNGINVELLSAKYNHGVRYETGTGPILIEQGFKSFEIPVLYKYHSDEGSYIELGMSFGKVQSAIQGGDITFGSDDPLHFYEEKFNAAIFGFGAHIFSTNNMFTSLGFRFGYTFSDIISEAGGKDGISYYPIKYGYNPDPVYLEYKPTNPLSIMLTLEVNYDLGYFVSSRCGKRAFISF